MKIFNDIAELENLYWQIGSPVTSEVKLGVQY